MRTMAYGADDCAGAVSPAHVAVCAVRMRIDRYSACAARSLADAHIIVSCAAGSAKDGYCALAGALDGHMR